MTENIAARAKAFLDRPDIKESIHKNNNLIYAYEQCLEEARGQITQYLLEQGVNPDYNVGKTIFTNMYENVVLPDPAFVLNPEILVIETYGFYGCEGNSFETTPDSALANINSYAFAYSDFDTLSFAEGLTTIWRKAFYEMRYLRKVFLPKSLVELGQDIFSNSTNLESIVYNGTVAEFAALVSRSSTVAFYGCNCREVECTDGRYDLDYDS